MNTKKIVIIDDAKEDREALKRYLVKDQANHYSIFEFGVVKDGIDFCKKDFPDCIIFDYSMPDLELKDAIDELKEHMQIVPAIVTTGQGSEEIAVAVMKDGAQDYLIKSALSTEVVRHAISTTIEKTTLQKNILFTQQELKTVLDTMVDGLVTISDIGRIDSINLAALKLFGYDRQEIINKNIKDLLPKINIKNYLKYDENVGKRKDGSLLPVELGISEMRIHNKKRIIINIKDITERKEREKEIQYQRDRANEANEAKTMFLATMSHEIRTPLNGIIGFADLLKNHDLDEKSKKYVKTISSSGELLLMLINDILDFSKIEAGELAIENISISLSDVIKQALNLFKEQASENNVKLHLQYDDNIPNFIISDPMRLKQVIINLVSNAIKFTKDANVYLNIKRKNSNNGSVRLLFEVIDEGIGIPQDKLKIIFESFSQVDSSTTREFGGTGLGLAICKRLVNLLGGEIGVQSEVNKGSKFFFELEFCVDKEKNELLRDISLASKEEVSYQYINNKKLNILVVEDDKVSQELVSSVLAPPKYNIDFAFNGQEAIEKITSSDKKFDMVFMDCQMPIMNGFDASKKIRQLEEFQDLKIVAMTANALQGDEEKCLKAGMNDYISKPIKIEDLENIFRKYNII